MSTDDTRTYEVRSNNGTTAWNLTRQEADEYVEWFAVNGVRTWIFAEH